MALAAPAAGAQTPPNVVILLADDVGYGDVGPYDHDNDPLTPDVTDTPVLDAMAAEGLTATDFYAGSAVCSPTRAALLTGRSCVRSGITNVLKPGSPNGLPASEVTIGEMLRPFGYRTGLIGKWHLGDDLSYNPVNHGFDEFYGVLYSNNQTPFQVLRNTLVVQGEPDQAQLTQDYTTEALQFVSNAAGAGQPFFLMVAYTMPHFPVYVSPAFDGITGRGLYSDAVYEMDWSVSQILCHLSSLGVDGDTLVIFVSDNGACDQVALSSHPGATFRWLCGSNAPYSGFKGGFNEGGIRVPLTARWPGVLPAGATTSAVGSVMDLLPTVARVTGVPTPAGRVIDGVDLLDAWVAGAPRELEEIHFYGTSTTERELVATRSGPWKLFFGWPGFTPDKLYDLTADPQETSPVADPALKATLHDRARAFHCALDDPYVAPPPTPAPNLALRKETWASSSLQCDTSARAVDGDATSAWTSAGPLEWLRVDLGREELLAEAALLWGPLPAVRYRLSVSLDGTTWDTVHVEGAGDGGLDTALLWRRARYFRIDCLESAGAGYALAELRLRAIDVTPAPIRSALPPVK